MAQSLYSCINFKLARAQSAVQQVFRQNLSAFNITPGQYMVLSCLWESPEPLSPTQIAQMIELEPSTIIGLLDRLTYKHLLERTPSPTDRRALIINLTDEGWALKDDVLRVIAETNEQVLKQFSSDERQTLMEYLAKLT
jgi:DNA-binding MarR family transcriptional regulator